MTKTKEEKNAYTREWREKNREVYLKKRREKYKQNADKYREKSKERATKYYYEVLREKRKENPDFWRKIDRERAQRSKQRKNQHLRRLREQLGGICTVCGYFEHLDILQFHHGNGDKEKNVSELQSYEKREREALKCVLLCPNCHAIKHLKHDDSN